MMIRSRLPGILGSNARDSDYRLYKVFKAQLRKFQGLPKTRPRKICNALARDDADALFEQIWSSSADHRKQERAAVGYCTIYGDMAGGSL